MKGTYKLLIIQLLSINYKNTSSVNSTALLKLERIKFDDIYTVRGSGSSRSWLKTEKQNIITIIYIYTIKSKNTYSTCQ